MTKDYSSVHYGSRTNEKMKEVLMDSGTVGPDIHYHMIRGGSEQRNITIWETGLVNKEYIKTYGHYHVGKLDETYWILLGEGIALAQKRVLDENGNTIDSEISEAYAVHVKPGDKIYFPPDWGHLLVNTSNTYFVTADDSPVNFEEKDPASLPGHADYEAVKEMQGFCYYVIEENGKPVLVKNTKYKKIPEIKIIEIEEYPFKK